VYKLATDLCAIKDSTDISAVDFDCLLTECANTPNPELTVAGILQLIIDNVCCSVTTLTSEVNSLTSKTSNLYEEPVLILPACLQYIDPISGIPVTQLVLSQYVQKLAQEFCNLYSVVNVHTSQIANHETRITALEVAPCCYTPPTVTPSCTYGSVTSGVPTQMNTMLQSLDFQLCTLSYVLGSYTQLSTAASQQCPNLGSLNALSQIGTMSSLSGWNGTVANLAQSIQNLWITVCDMRDAIISLKNCCAVDCSAFILGFTAIEDSTRNLVTLTFNSYTSIPSGFSNCPLLSTVTITDGDGKTYTDTFDLLTESTNPTGIQFDTTTTGLNPSLPHTVTVSGCVTQDGETCEKTVSYVLAVPTTTTTTTVAPTTTTTTAAPVGSTFIMNNTSVDGTSEITNSTIGGVSYYLLTTGTEPVTGGSTADGSYGSNISTGDNIVINYVGPSGGGCLQILKNTVVQDSQSVLVGAGSHTFTGISYTAGTDVLEIKLLDGPC
jgi:hypothetical protein